MVEQRDLITVVKGLHVEHQHINCSDKNDCELHKQIASLSFINVILCGGPTKTQTEIRLYIRY